MVSSYFKLNWTQIAQRRVFAYPVIVRFDVLKKGCTCFVMCRKGDLSSTFTLQSSEKPLHHRIIPAVSFAAHADTNIEVLEVGEVAPGWYTDTLDQSDGASQLLVDGGSLPCVALDEPTPRLA